MSTETSYHFIFLLQVSKKSLILYNILNDLIHVCSPIKAGAANDQETISTEMSSHFVHLLHVSKKMSLKSDFIHFFHGLLHVYSPGAEADSPQGPPF